LYGAQSGALRGGKGLCYGRFYAEPEGRAYV
jgi:hypothetical protein